MLAVILIAISLSIDAFGIGTTYGMRKVKVKFMPKVIIAFISFVITFLALSMGTQLQKILPDIVTQIIGVGILFFMGSCLIFQSFKPEDNNNSQTQDSSQNPNLDLNSSQELIQKQKAESNKKNPARVYNISLKAFNLIIKIIHKPKLKQENNNKTHNENILSLTEAFCMGFALSIDSIGSGIGLSLIGYNNFYLPVATAVCQYVFLSLGIFLGDKISNLKIDHRKFIFLSGLILIFFAAIRII